MMDKSFEMIVGAFMINARLMYVHGMWWEVKSKVRVDL